MRIAYLAFNEFEELDLAGPWELTGQLIKRGLLEDAFIVAERLEPLTAAQGMRVVPHYGFAECPEFDVLLVPGGVGRKREVNNPKLIEFVQERAKRCKWVLSVCTGAFILQKAGLLEGKKACTYWSAIGELRQLGVDVVEERWVRSGNVWCSSGVSAGMDMMLAFLNEVLGEATAEAAQLFAEYYPEGKVYGQPQARVDAPAYLKDR